MAGRVRSRRDHRGLAAPHARPLRPVTGLRGARHGALYAYLEDVQPSGRVTYVTEGELALADRAIAPANDNPAWRTLRTPRTYARADAAPFPLGTPQQVTFDLLPTSGDDALPPSAGDHSRLFGAAEAARVHAGRMSAYSI
jgi:hypothetical protein